jgi:hypothetical protein
MRSAVFPKKSGTIHFMISRIVSMSLACLGSWVLSMQPASAAEIFFMDRDAFSNEYVGPVGPPVLSGEIVPGDYERLLAKIAEDQNRFLSQNKLILASSQGNAEEAMKIARLVKSLYIEVIVAPLTGRCAGACFLIYAAAAQRGTDGENLLGVSRPGLAESEWAAMPTAQAALLEDTMQTSVRTFLNDNEVSPDIVEEMFKRPPTDIYWLNEQQEAALSPKSPSFAKLLADKCGWNDGLERAVLHGQRPVDDLKELTACRLRTTQPEARKALAQALKDAQPKDAKPKDAKLNKAAPTTTANAAPAAKKKATKKKAAKKNSVAQSSTTRGK